MKKSHSDTVSADRIPTRFLSLLLAGAMVLSLYGSLPALAGAAGVAGAQAVSKKGRVAPSVSAEATPNASSLAATATVQTPAINSAAPRGSAVCKIGSVKYHRLADALAAVPNSKATTIKLLANITHTDPCVLKSKKITFNLNSHNLIFKCSAGVALNLTNCNIDYTGAGTFQVISTGAAALCVSGGSCKVTHAKVDARAAEMSGVAIGAYHKAVVSVKGNIEASGEYAEGIIAWHSTVNVGGCVNAKGEQAIAVDASDSEIAIKKTVSVSGESSCALSLDNCTVDIGGSVIAIGWGDAIYPGGSTITIHGKIKVSNTAISDWAQYPPDPQSKSCSTVTVAGGINAYTALEVSGATKMSLTGDIASCSTGIDAWGDAEITMKGDIHATWDAISVDESSCVALAGSIFMSGKDSCGVLAGEGTKVTVSGNIAAKGRQSQGIHADSGAQVKVGGRITATGNAVFADNYVYTGPAGVSDVIPAPILPGNNTTDTARTPVIASTVPPIWHARTKNTGTPTRVYVAGNVISKTDTAVSANNGAEVTIDGTVTSATSYVMVGGKKRKKSAFVTPATKAGYRTYTDGESSVWVKVPAPPLGLPDAGDAASFLAPVLLLMAGVGAAGVCALRRRRLG
ncbi:MAG: hypothetical protein FWD65_00325 [Coriobacteriia bacterium]|nr:hypothetical protein [Coriobacteriia bacterium]